MPPPHLLCFTTHTSHLYTFTTPVRRAPCSISIIVYSLDTMHRAHPPKGAAAYMRSGSSAMLAPLGANVYYIH